MRIRSNVPLSCRKHALPRWYRVVQSNTTNNVVYYLLLRLHVSALSLGHHQVSNRTLDTFNTLYSLLQGTI